LQSPVPSCSFLRCDSPWPPERVALFFWMSSQGLRKMTSTSANCFDFFCRLPQDLVRALNGSDVPRRRSFLVYRFQCSRPPALFSRVPSFAFSTLRASGTRFFLCPRTPLSPVLCIRFSLGPFITIGLRMPRSFRLPSAHVHGPFVPSLFLSCNKRFALVHFGLGFLSCFFHSGQPTRVFLPPAGLFCSIVRNPSPREPFLFFCYPFFFFSPSTTRGHPPAPLSGISKAVSIFCVKEVCPSTEFLFSPPLIPPRLGFVRVLRLCRKIMRLFSRRSLPEESSFFLQFFPPEEPIPGRDELFFTVRARFFLFLSSLGCSSSPLDFSAAMTPPPVSFSSDLSNRCVLLYLSDFFPL